MSISEEQARKGRILSTIVLCCILSGQIKGNTVPISAIWHRSSLELCHYLDTGIVWLKLPKTHPPPSNLKRSLLQVVETSCPIKGVMCTRKGMHKECNKSVVTQLTRAHGIY